MCKPSFKRYPNFLGPLQLPSLVLASILGYLILPASLSAQTQTTESTRVVTADSRYVEVIGSEPLTVQQVYRTAVMTENEFFRVFRNPGGRKLVVSLIRDDSQQQVFTSIDEYAVTTVTLRHAEEIDDATVVQAIVQGLLARSIAARFDRERISRLPVWIELAMTDYIRARFNTAWEDDLVRQAQARQFIPIVDILSSQRGELPPEELRPNAYWLLSSLREAAGNRFHFGDGILQLAITDNREALLRTFLPAEAASRESLYEWWAVQYTAAAYRPIAPVFNFTLSREFIASMQQMVVLDEGDPRLIHLSQLKELYQDPLIRQIVQNKLSGIRQNVTRINPIYFNALLSLGQAYEAYLAQDTNGLEIALAQYEQDKERARASSSRIVQLLE